MKGFWKLLFAPCSEISRHTSMALDEDLSRAQRLAIRLHYLHCTACRRYRRQIRLIRDAMRQAGSGAEPDETKSDVTMPSETRGRIKRALSQR